MEALKPCIVPCFAVQSAVAGEPRMRANHETGAKIMKAKGYSLWVMPTGEAYDTFSILIKRLAQEYDAPVFDPHVTVLGEATQPEAEIIKRAEQLAQGHTPFQLHLHTIDYQDAYFRALFVRVQESEPLLALHQRAQELFQMPALPGYMPHLSLLYGHFPQAVKETIIATIGQDLAARFTVRSLHVVKTEGDVKHWSRIKEVTLL